MAPKLLNVATPSVDLGGEGVNQGMQDTQAASTLLQLYTNTVLQTPDINLPQQVDTDSKSTVVEDLPKHQATARTNAQNYLTNINPLMVKTIGDIIGFSNLWNAEYTALLQLAQNIDQGDNKTTFTQGVQNLINKTTSSAANIQPVLTALNAFLPLIQQDSRNFQADLNNVTVALGGQQGEIAQLKKQLDAINSAINKDTAMIAGGAVADVVGGLMIVVGLLAEFETGGLSTGLVVGGLAVIGGGSTMIGLAAKDLSEKTAEYKQLATELQIEQQVYTATQQSSTVITSLLNAVNQGISAVESLQKGWTSLQGDFQQTIDQLGSADPNLGSWLTSILDAANRDWQDTYQLALHLQQNGVIPVQSQGTSQSKSKAA